MSQVYIQAGLRSPIGIEGKQFAKPRPEHLGAELINQLLRQALGAIDELICGNALGTGGNIGRLMTLYSDLAQTVPAVTLDMQCASAGAAIQTGYANIKAGLAERVLVGGIESSSLQPERRYALGDDRQGAYRVAQFSPDFWDSLVMFRGAQEVAKRYQFTKEDLDSKAFISHQKAIKAQEEGVLDSLIMSLVNKKDQGIRAKISQKMLRKIPPILGPKTVISAGNACLTHDAAAFLILGKEKSAFRICDMVTLAGDPQKSPLMILKASQEVLKRQKLSMSDIAAIEWNEAFAVMDSLFEHHFPESLDNYNIFGGALAYGHPFGASAAINVLHLMKALEYKKGRFGLAAIAAAGGQGFAILIEYMKGSANNC
ncbi:acetyl-CoA C-acyltransferase [Streptococcus ictaluri]|uniref:acetyl-CoA C-acetyltransferase n=1 Tax=Streptococcus ictaluri 707-05 TaxID=764299 RepID=G5K1Y9_9STRE|nr:acetyl-CoA C-acyltransferase [Streptococcus ictaluri]EHI70088.1 acetyl-CoA C-acetyltransferase [Streptococcus ictaluri 707-05]